MSALDSSVRDLHMMPLHIWCEYGDYLTVVKRPRARYRPKGKLRRPKGELRRPAREHRHRHLQESIIVFQRGHNHPQAEHPIGREGIWLRHIPPLE